MTVATNIRRFALVGLINTSVDAGVFSLLHSQGMSVFAANLCSTSLGLACSFMLNSHYTFDTKAMTRQRILLFLAVTLTGLWLLQPIVIALLSAAHVAQPFIAVFGNASLLQSLLPKLGAISLTLVWNFLWYSRVVYR